MVCAKYNGRLGIEIREELVKLFKNFMIVKRYKRLSKLCHEFVMDSLFQMERQRAHIVRSGFAQYARSVCNVRPALERTWRSLSSIAKGLGIELRKPAGFRFVDFDAVWPNPTLVGLAGVNGDKVSLQSRRRQPWEEAGAAAWSRLEAEVPSGRRSQMKVAGRAAYLLGDGDRAAVAVPGSEVVWILTAEGPRAGALVRQVAAGLRM